MNSFSTEVQTLSQKLRLHPLIIEILSSRNFEENDITDFLSWDLKKLPDLTKLKDCELAAKRIIKAIEKNETIGVYGDYDVDGATSCALLFHFFKMFEITPLLIQPSRFVEGYGIHPPSVEEAHLNGIDVLITVDCGITACPAAEKSKELGIDLIITDHHTDASENMPEAFAIINPNRRDEPKESSLKPLAGVGVAFALALKVKTLWEKENPPIPSLYPLLQFVAIGTISDLAPINSVNAKLVRHGLKQLPQTQYKGLKQFLDQEETKLNFIPSEKVSFSIGPLINSRGRLEHPEMALSLLTSLDSDEAFEYFQHLDISNKERKKIQADIAKEAKSLVIKDLAKENCPAAIVYASHWHEGVIGIVASRIVEEFKIPALVFCNASEEGVIKASARTAGELNLFDALNKHRDFFLKFGGHKAAAGLSMPIDKFAEFKKCFFEYLNNIPAITRTKIEEFDTEIDLADITPAMVKSLNVLEPFGNSNPKPSFKINRFKVVNYKILQNKHVQWNLASTTSHSTSIKAISFNFIGKWDQLSPEEIVKISESGRNLSLLGTLNINHFRGNQYLQIMAESFWSQL